MPVRLLRAITSVLRRVWPVPRLFKRVVVTRQEDVLDVLKRNRDFTIAQVNDRKMKRTTGAFFLGMDFPDYGKEAELVRRAVKRGDLERIKRAVTADAERRIAEVIVSGNRIDVVEQLARPVAAGLVGSYFGVPGPDLETLMRWNRTIFHDIFLNFGNKPAIREPAIVSSLELNAYLERLIADLGTRIKSGAAVPDTFLSRLIRAQPNSDCLDAHGNSIGECLDAVAIRRNISGILLGAVETTSKVVTVAIDELMKRPKALAGAQAAAGNDDIEGVKRYAWEAMRFNPHNPLVIRHAPHDTEIGGRQVRAGDTVYAVTLSAMFDPTLFPKPKEFRVDRPLESYLHFGYGLHRCFGEYINGVQIPLLLQALLRLPGLRRPQDGSGNMKMAGPFPERLLLDFG